MIKGSIKALLVTIFAVSLVLPFSISSFADDITNFGDVNISGGNNTVSTATGNITMDSGTIQIGSTNDSQQIVQNTANTNTKLDTVISSLTNINNSLATLFGRVTSPICILYDSLFFPQVQSASSTRNFTVAGQSYSYNLKQISVAGTNYYFNFSGLFNYYMNNLICNLTYPYIEATTSSASTQKVLSYSGYPAIVTKTSYYRYTYNASTDVVSASADNDIYYVTFLGSLLREFNVTLVSNFNANIQYLADTWYRWYNPNISAADSQFWIAFNTDTEVYDHVNLSTVFGYITWYLGQLYIQGNEAAADISQSVSDMSTAFTDLETKENQINSSIKNSLNSVDSFFNLPAIASGSVVIGWLQYMWVSLGMFQGVTIIAWALIILTIVTGFYKVKRITV